MLFHWEGDCAERVTSVLDTGELDGHSEDEDDEEEGIVEEIPEDVDFGGLQFSCVDLVEDLKQNESVEEDAVMLSAIYCPLLNADRGLDAENLRT